MAYGRYTRTTRRTFSSKKPKTNNTRRSYPRRKSTRTTFEQRVTKVLHSKAETKQKTIDIALPTPINGTGLDNGVANLGFTVNNVLHTLALAQGTNQETRIGNSVSNAYLRFRGYVRSLPYDGTTNTSTLPFEVHVLFYKQKNYNGVNVETEFLKQHPGNTNGPITGDVETTLYPFNRNQYTIKKRLVFKMRPLAITETASSFLNGQQSNAPAFRRFACNVPISKLLKFRDTSTTPLNDWVSVGAFIIDGSGQSLANNQVRAQIYLSSTLKYDDI
jgi:hypothetical protein